MTHIKRIDEMAVRFSDAIDNKVDFAKKQSQINLNNFKSEVKRILKSLPINDMVDAIDTFEYSKQKGLVSNDAAYNYDDIRLNEYGCIVYQMFDEYWYKCALVFDKEDFYLCVYHRDPSYGSGDILNCSTPNTMNILRKTKNTVKNIVNKTDCNYVNSISFYAGNTSRKSSDNIKNDLLLQGIQDFARKINGFVDKFFNDIKN